MTDSTRVSSDGEVWIGAPEIAAAILGSTSPRAVRRVRHLHEMGKLPTFKLGRQLCLRPATWRQYLAEREVEADALRAAARAEAEAA